MDERRSIERTRILRNAKIIVDPRSPIVYCTVQNVSNTGACLSLASTFRLPDTFELTFEAGRSRRKCRVIWRTASKIGVTFEQPAGAAPRPDAPETEDASTPA
jgi:hypothetical protein